MHKRNYLTRCLVDNCTIQCNCRQRRYSGIATAYVMTKNIQMVLSPLLMINYVCGLRIVEFPAGQLRPWFSLLYILLLWSLYSYILIYKVISYTVQYSTVYHTYVGLNILISLLSIAIGVHHDKTFRNCIKKIIIVDDTLEKLGIRTDYYKLRMMTIALVLCWSMLIMLIIYKQIRLLREEHHDISEAVCITFVRNYCYYINSIGDFTNASILGYIGIKFDQINEHLGKLARDNERKIREHPVLVWHQSRFSETPNKEWMTWIIMHLHSELRQISREIDSIFGTQMTFEMGNYFSTVVLGAQEIFRVIFINNYTPISDKNLYITLILFCIFLDIFRLFLINYMYERVSTKASATGDSINRLSYSIYDVEIRENILQLLLQITQSPLRFYGLGLFQFGFKFLRRFATSVGTVLVIILQAHTNK